MTFPENPNNIDSPLAWNPLSTGIGKLPPGSLRAWWDASKLNANDIWWGFVEVPHTPCGGFEIYSASGTLGSTTLTVATNNFLFGVPPSGIMFKLQGIGDTTYRITNVINSNTFTVTPAFSETFSGKSMLVAQLIKWPDASGNREHLGIWHVADTYSPSTYILDTPFSTVYRDGYMYHRGNGSRHLSFQFVATDKLSLRGTNLSTPEPLAVREIIIATHNTGNSNNLRVQLEGYLAWKWGSQEKLPISHLHANAPESNTWSPIALGNDLQLWFDANDIGTLFSDNGCSSSAILNGNIACWRDKSGYERHLYQLNDTIPQTYRVHQGRPAVWIDRGTLTQNNNITWLNNQNILVAIALDRVRDDPRGLKRSWAQGPLFALENGLGKTPENAHSASGGLLFPYPYASCIGNGLYGHKQVAYSYWQSRGVFAIESAIEGKFFYKPYFHRNIQSSLSTQSRPNYLNQQPYMIALVADFVEPPSIAGGYAPVFLGTLMPVRLYHNGIDRLFEENLLALGGVYPQGILGIGASSTVAGRFMATEALNNLNYNMQLPTTPSVYLWWRKNNQDVPWLTINGKPVEPVSGTTQSGYLNITTHELMLLSMGDYHSGAKHRFSGSIYEAMVLTGPKLKYGHQRLIEGYLAWKWGLQKKLPKSHSYYHVPPAR
jgi:hypothetical protein